MQLRGWGVASDLPFLSDRCLLLLLAFLYLNVRKTPLLLGKTSRRLLSSEDASVTDTNSSDAPTRSLAKRLVLLVRFISHDFVDFCFGGKFTQSVL